MRATPNPHRTDSLALLQRLTHTVSCHRKFLNRGFALGCRENKRVPAPWVPPVKSATDAQNFEGEDYGPDKRVAPYTGDGAWYDDF